MGAETERLVAIAQSARLAPHGEKGRIYDEAARSLGISRATLMSKLQDINGRQRKRRADAGQVELDRAEADLLSAYLTESRRANAKRLLSAEDAVEQLRAAGRILAARVDETTGEVFPLSISAITRALRTYGMHPDQLKRPAPVTHLISRHPNHVWQLDPSLCVLYYLRPSKDAASGLQVMAEDVFYKNKPANVAKVESERVWRYVVTDHASGCLYARYVMGAESAVNLVESFIHAIQPRAGEPFHGVPFNLMMDPGSANTSATARNLFKALQVRILTNKPGQPRAKGQVEEGNNLIERKFESGLRFVPVRDLDHLNETVGRWLTWFNGTADHGRHAMTRFAAWQLIAADELRLAPAPDLCRELARSAPQQRKVAPDLTISFQGQQYHVDRVPGVMVGEKLEICTNPYRLGGAQAITWGEDGREIYHLLPAVERDRFGFDQRGAVIGEEHKSRVKTRADENRETVEALAMGTHDAEASSAKRKAKALPFDGQINPFQRSEEYQAPAWMPKRGTEHPLQTPDLQAPPLTHIAAAKLLRAELEAVGGAWSTQRYAWLVERYPAGVPESAIAGLLAELAAPIEHPAQAAGLRLVK